MAPAGCSASAGKTTTDPAARSSHPSDAAPGAISAIDDPRAAISRRQVLRHVGYQLLVAAAIVVQVATSTHPWCFQSADSVVEGVVLCTVSPAATMGRVGALAIVTWWLVGVARYDWVTGRIPDVEILPVGWAAGVLLLSSGHGAAVITGLGWWLAYLIIATICGGLGGGDIKLAGVLGMLLPDAGSVLLVLGIASVLHLLLLGKLRTVSAPHSPAMVAATGLVVFAGM
ncbi:prepilin peptidase [Corynebacterium choanae]|uniref:prepilin peptidase n=1 Tax=Corynebacterium choanae TaxID=1862358 RepID=UPI0013DE4577|nr:A24 family peptidase [Corynebacterium choanae]